MGKCKREIKDVEGKEGGFSGIENVGVGRKEVGKHEEGVSIGKNEGVSERDEERLSG